MSEEHVDGRTLTQRTSRGPRDVKDSEDRSGLDQKCNAENLQGYDPFFILRKIKVRPRVDVLCLPKKLI